MFRIRLTRFCEQFLLSETDSERENLDILSPTELIRRISRYRGLLFRSVSEMTIEERIRSDDSSVDSMAVDGIDLSFRQIITVRANNCDKKTFVPLPLRHRQSCFLLLDQYPVNGIISVLFFIIGSRYRINNPCFLSGCVCFTIIRVFTNLLFCERYRNCDTETEKLFIFIIVWSYW